MTALPYPSFATVAHAGTRLRPVAPPRSSTVVARVPQPPVITVAVVGPTLVEHPTLRAVFAQSTELRWLCSCLTSAQALALLPAREPDVVLMDTTLPDGAGSVCLRELKLRRPEIEVLMFSECENRHEILGALRAGAGGYLLSSTSPAAVLAAILELQRGGAPLSSVVARKVVQSLRDTPAQRNGSVLETLSPRQRSILDRLAQGRTDKEVASDLGLSVETVRSYVKLVYRKLHVRSRTEAVLAFLT